MSSKPLVSIVTPSFNQGPFLEETIQSVLEQTYDPIEYIVIDGGSTDSSIEIIRRHERQLAYWVSEPDKGQSHGINKGLHRSTGAVIGWLNSDDTLLPDAVARVVDAMQDTPTVVHGSVHLIDAQSEIIARPKLSKRNQEFGIQTIVGEGLVNQPGAFWNRVAMDRAGYLNENLNYIMDYELWVRMALAGASFKRLG
ncbi:MAG: glycosyltransferase, partial [Anaerolineae bacterium]|nr:glycosyltransferase [Anaerolineae bacterium]